MSSSTSSAPPASSTTVAGGDDMQKKRVWIEKVHAAQFSRMTPAQRDALLHRANHAQKSTVAAHSAKSVEYKTRGWKKSAMSALCDMRRDEQEEEEEEECNNNNNNNSSSSRMKQTKTKSHDVQTRTRERATRCLAEMEQQTRSYEPAAISRSVQLQQQHQAFHHEDVFPVITEPEAATAAEESTGLESLRVEPTDDEVAAAKFSVFEAFSAKVTAVRDDLMKVVADAEEVLPETANAAVRADVSALDSTRNLGIYNESRNWFVYDMMVQSGKNAATMESLSRGIAAKAELASTNAQPECPICLEVWGEGGEVVPLLLGCCHRVCQPCWVQWTEVQAAAGNTPFCPLCRHAEFLDVVHTLHQ
eukprot:PhM_4_TR9444/c1_g1_i1/m.59878